MLCLKSVQMRGQTIITTPSVVDRHVLSQFLHAIQSFQAFSLFFTSLPNRRRSLLSCHMQIQIKRNLIAPQLAQRATLVHSARIAKSTRFKGASAETNLPSCRVEHDTPPRGTACDERRHTPLMPLMRLRGTGLSDCSGSRERLLATRCADGLTHTHRACTRVPGCYSQISVFTSLSIFGPPFTHPLHAP